MFPAFFYENVQLETFIVCEKFWTHWFNPGAKFLVIFVYHRLACVTMWCLQDEPSQ